MANVTIIQAESELADIAVQMLGAGMVIDTMNAPLKHRKDAFDAVCSHVPAHILASAVIDAVMPVNQTAKFVVNRAFVGVDCRADLHVAISKTNCAATRNALRHFSTNATSFTRPARNNRRLANPATAKVEPLAFVLRSFLAPDIAFVNFDNASQFDRVIATRFTKPLQHEPSRLLRDADLFGELQAGYALARRNEQIHRIKPLVQRYLRPLKYRAGADGEIKQASVAAIETTLAGADALCFATGRADSPVRPATALKVSDRTVLIGEHLKQLESRYGGFGHSINPSISVSYCSDKKITTRLRFGSQVYNSHTEAPILKVHDAGYIEFLKTAHARWVAAGRPGDVMGYVWPVVARRALDLTRIDALAGRYSMDNSTPLTADSWTSAYWSTQCALSALDAMLAGDKVAVGLCRPPGHHAGADYLGGYCFINQAAVAAQAARDAGIERVAILDIDYHHGNGTQDIFWNRGDVFYASVHADPATDFPFYWGHADETGEGDGVGATLNLPLPQGTEIEVFRAAQGTALAAIAEFAPGLLIVSFGADTFAGDPIANFALQTADYAVLASDIAAAQLPTVVLTEGGYAVDKLGENLASFLSGF